MALDKTFDPALLEKACYDRWEKSGCFIPKGDGAPYCIMIPPPNVTGHLHMGHAFQQTLMDILIRYHRMQGRKTLWQVGTDHAGIATQMVVERQLLAENHSRHTIGREAFIDRVWQWKKESGDNITRQLRRIGASVDWSSERFTLDEGLSKAVINVFIHLYEEGLIYRGKRLVNWDPILKTAVSDLEVETEEESGSLWYIRYPLTDGTGNLVVATTRPETVFGDVAVAVHPEDKRYKHLIGKMLQLPLTDRTIPIIGDSAVEVDFGTGCVKITPAHDFHDYAMGERHQLPCINIFTPDATLNDTVPKIYQGLDRFFARKKIIADLSTANLLEKIEAHTLKIPRGDRSGAVLEPFLTDQWFVNIKPLATPAIQAVETGEIRFVPENWSKIYFDWMLNIQDWCISRQLWWGHRIPAWYDAAGNIYVAEHEQAVRLKYHLPNDLPLKQDEDVLDTWFSSALWPFSTLGWPENTERFQTFYPTQVLVTGFDIIFFWVARMIMFGLKFTGKIPFHEVYIHGLILDPEGQKMSKTKGNVLDPIDLIDGIDLTTLIQKRTYGLMQPKLAQEISKKTTAQFSKGIPAYGADALRFTYAALATTGRQIRFDLGRIEGYRHFCNKLWNAARFVFMHTEEKMVNIHASKILSTVDQWILSVWQKTKQHVEKYLVQYRFDLAAQALYEFTWNEYCDWYLELSKPTLNPDVNYDPKLVLGLRYTLITILEELLRVMHPFMPYITETLWQQAALIAQTKGDAKTIMLQPYPEYSEKLINTKAEEEINWVKEIILGIRNIRGTRNISPAKYIPALLFSPKQHDKLLWKKHKNLIVTQAKLDVNQITEHESKEQTNLPLGFVDFISVGTLEIGIILPKADIEKEINFLKKKINELEEKLIIENERLKNMRHKAPERAIKDRESVCVLLEQEIAQKKQQLADMKPYASDF